MITVLEARVQQERERLELAAIELDWIDGERRRDPVGRRLPSPIWARYLRQYNLWIESVRELEEARARVLDGIPERV